MTKTELINIRRLKEFAFTELPKNWALREALLIESEEIDIPTFLALLRVWLRLSALSRGEKR